MISPAYCLTMARYNAWQNRTMERAMKTLPHEELVRNRGAFFNSILDTANHLIWGDELWLSRFGAVPKPNRTSDRGIGLCPTLAAWSAERFRLDGRLLLWAEKVHALDLTGDLEWFSGGAGRDMRRPMALAVTHMFNHQAHHRGQIHAMLTAAGAKTESTDLVFMETTGG